MQCPQCDAEAHAIVDRLHTLRPAAEYHEDMGDVLWWWLPIDSPPVVGKWDDWNDKWNPEGLLDNADPPTHFSLLPLSELLTASDGAEVAR